MVGRKLRLASDASASDATGEDLRAGAAGVPLTVELAQTNTRPPEQLLHVFPSFSPEDQVWF